MKKFLLPVVLVLVSTGTAIVTQSFKSSEGPTAPGYRIDKSDPNNHVCVSTSVQCSTIPSPFKCQDAAMNNLWELVGTSCPNELFRP